MAGHARPTLKLAMVDAQTIQNLCNRIVQESQPDRIILFGSYAYGNPAAVTPVNPPTRKRPPYPLISLPIYGKTCYP